LLRVRDHFRQNQGTRGVDLSKKIRRRVLRKESVVKKPILPLALGLCLSLTSSLAAAPAGETDITPLSNKDIIVMVQQRVSEEAIIKAIQSSPCTFDTFPPLLKDMKRKGVPEAVLQAMLQAPYGPAAVTQTTNRDDLGEQPIYHYADQLRQMGYITPSQASRNNRYPQQNRRASRTRRQQ
jgi:hypothetical protein